MSTNQRYTGGHCLLFLPLGANLEDVVTDTSDWVRYEGYPDANVYLQRMPYFNGRDGSMAVWVTVRSPYISFIMGANVLHKNKMGFSAFDVYTDDGQPTGLTEVCIPIHCGLEPKEPSLFYIPAASSSAS